MKDDVMDCSRLVRRILLRGTIAALTLLVVCKPSGLSAKTAAPLDHDRKTEVVRVVERVRDAVVNLATERVVREHPFDGFGDDLFERFFGQYPERSRQQQSLGSGVIISERGTIVTNEHVVLRAGTIKVKLASGTELDAELLGSSQRFDVAVLRVKPDSELTAVPVGDSTDMMIGETVIAIGNPLGLGHTVTTGVVSALHRSLDAGDGRIYDDLIQSDASINPGNSGGPLLNIRGELVGINSAILAGAEGIGFAIPIRSAVKVVDELLRYGFVRRGWIGLAVQELSADMASHLGLSGERGVVIRQVVEGSPAAEAGLERGAILKRVGSRHVESVEDFWRLLLSLKVGDELPIQAVTADGTAREVSVEARLMPMEVVRNSGFRRLGFTLRENSGALASRFNLGTDKGLLIDEVYRGSPAARVGLRPGDVVLEANGESVSTVEEWFELLQPTALMDSVLLSVQRGSGIYRVSVRPVSSY